MPETINVNVELEPLDTSDVDRWIGKPIGGGQLKEAISVTDIRRWVQGMQNPNPLYFDEHFAAESIFKQIVAPLSFTICCDVGHGATPSIQGTIPGSHMLFGGDEWWFFGPRIYPGDKLHSERLAFDYRVTNTRFAGPTMFQRGDTTYINQRGEVVARQRSTSIRYLVANAHKLNSMAEQEKEPVWTDEQLEQVENEKLSYYRSFQNHGHRSLKDVEVGQTLPTGVLGPHSIQSMTTEWRSYIFTVWGASASDGRPTSTDRAGWLPAMSRNDEVARIDPSGGDGLYRGPSRGHVDQHYARVIGMPRAYGYGASMGAWVLDYVSNWAGEDSLVTHSNIQYRNPAFSGDVTYLRGKVINTQVDPDTGQGLVTIQVDMSTQTGTLMARGPVEVQLPAE